MLIIEFLVGVLVVVAFAITFVMGVSCGDKRMSKVYGDMLIKQHACLIWALEYVMAPDDVDSSTTEEEMIVWSNDYDTALNVAAGDINALLSEE